jgi:hypothetical protein
MVENGRVFGSRRFALTLAGTAAALLAVGQAGLWLRIEPIATWSYDLSWWSAILFADAVVHLRTGSSILISRPRGFLGLAIASAPYWLLYECANLRLANWYYVGVPADLFTRTVGVFVSFATVLPGVLEVDALIASFSPRSDRPPGARKIHRGVGDSLRIAGAASLILPLLFPRAAYPLIWGAAFLLLEPWLAERDERSLLGRLVDGDRRPLLRMIAAGLATGAMWETWNWRSPAKWIYTVPLFEDGKLFEMPYLGFIGFVPFALGCHSVGRALVAARWIPEWDPSVPVRRPAELVRASVAGVAALLFSVVAIAAVDRFTIHATRPNLTDVPGVTAAAADRLARAGIHTVDEVAAGDADVLQLDRSAVDAARLMTVRGMGRRGLEWLAGVGIHSVVDLAAKDPVDVHRTILAAPAGPDPVPTLAEVRVWVVGARLASR